MVAPAYRVVLSPNAGRDLEQIHGFIAAHSEDGAVKLVTRFLDAFDSLQLFPHRTVFQSQSSRVRRQVRKLPVPPYIVYFRVIEEDKVVRILNVRHGARRPPRRFD